MRCGNRKNNCLPKLLRICSVFLILFGGAFSAACQSKPKEAAALLLPCQEFLDKGDLAAAGECYEKTLVANSKQADQIQEVFSKSFFKKCLEFKEEKNYQQSIICLEGLSVLAPDSANVQLQLADAYFQYYKNRSQKDPDLLERADIAIKKSLKINPELAITYETYGEILDEKGDLQNSLKAHRQSVTLEPKKIRLWINLALLQEKIGDSSSALISYYQVLMLDPKNTLALYYSAKLYEKTGNKDQAIKNYEKLLEIEAKFDDARERLEKLKEKKVEPNQKTKIQGAPNNGTYRLPY